MRLRVESLKWKPSVVNPWSNIVKKYAVSRWGSWVGNSRTCLTLTSFEKKICLSKAYKWWQASNLFGFSWGKEWWSQRQDGKVLSEWWGDWHLSKGMSIICLSTTLQCRVSTEHNQEVPLRSDTWHQEELYYERKHSGYLTCLGNAYRILPESLKSDLTEYCALVKAVGKHFTCFPYLSLNVEISAKNYIIGPKVQLGKIQIEELHPGFC